MARQLCCMVVAEGPDLTGAVAAAVPFHGTSSGVAGGVALSCSSVVLGSGGDDGNDTTILIAAPLGLLSPFFLSQDRGGGGVSAAALNGRSRYNGCGGGNNPALPPPGVSLRVLLPPPTTPDKDDESDQTGRWEDAQVAGVARLPACAAALRAALSRLRSAEPLSSSQAAAAAARWRLGWALGGGSNNKNNDSEAADEAAAFLVLRIRGRRAAAPSRASAEICCRCSSSPPRPASPVVAWGAPFGALAPFHFAHSAVAGVVSGALSSSSSSLDPPAVLRLDVAALPGMEGGPVACARCGGLAAVLSRPLARGAGGGGGALVSAEVPLAFPARLVVEACLSASGGDGAQTAAMTAKAAATAAAAAAATAASFSPVERALTSGVVMIRCGGAWATGVVMPRSRVESSSSSPDPVLVLTIAHLFDQAAGAAGAAGATPQPPAAARVRVACPRTGQHAWSSPALLLHRFRSPHLDLAVLAVPYPADQDSGGDAQLVLRAGLDALSPLELLPPPSSSSPAPPPPPPLPIVVAGHGLFGPALDWPAAATAGSLARTVAAGAGAPTMALTTATVHAGASGAAVLCAASGRLAAVATSNSRHVSPAALASKKSASRSNSSSATTTLPRWNYAVPAHALRPLWRWAEEEERGRRRRGRPFDAGRARSQLEALDRAAMAEGGEAAARVWALLPPAADGAARPRAKL